MDMDCDYEYLYDDDDDDHSSAGDINSDRDLDEFIVNEDSDRQLKNYTVLNEEDIRRLQQDHIARVSNVLSIPATSASLLLRTYKWSVNTVNEAWFADEDGVRKSVGLLKNPTVQYRTTAKLLCGICFEVYPRSKTQSLSCGHPYCTDCWKGYISTAINDGHGCLMLRCPDPACKAAVLEDLVDKLASDEDKKRYQHYIVESYVESNRKTKWCPAAGCDCAVEFDIGSGSYDVNCVCSYNFCWNCSEDAHRPVDCDTVAKWILKNSRESENVTWILANSKPCPKCKKPIEKNKGCSHMTCRPPCGYEFCWLCLATWHNYGACNKFVDEDETEREMAKKHIARYTHYYERWMNNNNGWKKAILDLEHVKTDLIKKISEKQIELEINLQFIVEVWEQIVECRRVLKFSYAYGYYIPESDKNTKKLFEYLQGEAEAGLERLHKCAEDELKQYAAEAKSADFNEFRIKLKRLTDVTRKFFENLVRGLENGLAEVLENNMSKGKSKSKRRKGKNSNIIESSSSNSNSTTTNTTPYITNITSSSGGTDRVIGDDDDDDDDDDNAHDSDVEGAEAEYWTCDLCTLVNRNPRRLRCKACHLNW